MPEKQVEFRVKVPIEKAWEFLSNMETLGSCVPGCKEVKKVSENEYNWVLEAKVLHTLRTINAKTRATEIIPPTHVSFAGEGKLIEGLGFYKVTLAGSMNLQAISDTETKVVFDGSVSAAGVGGAIINKIASGQMGDLLRDFELNVISELEKYQ